MAHLDQSHAPFVRSLVFIGALVLNWPGVALGQVKSYAVVPSASANTVTAIDATTNTPLGGAIAVGTGPRAVAISPDALRAYVMNVDDDTVSVIDVATWTVVFTTAPGGGTTTGLAVARDGTRLYLAKPTPASVVPIDIPSYVALPPFTVGLGGSPRRIAVAPDGQTAYVTTDNGTYPLNLTTGVFGTPIPTGIDSYGIAIAPDGLTAYVTNLMNSQVVVVDLGLGSVSTAIPVGLSPSTVAFSPDGTVAYVANAGNNALSVIDVATHTVALNVPTGVAPQSVAFRPDGQYAYVTEFLGNLVTTFDAVAHAPIGAAASVANPAADGGGFVTPNIIVQSGGPLNVANDAELQLAGFRSFVPFHQGTLRLTDDWTASRNLSMLSGGGTIDTNGFDAAVTGSVVGDGALTKVGAGRLTLTGSARHTGGTIVTAGTLMVNGIHTAPITVTSGALRGHGTLGDVTMGDATWAPGEGSIGLHEAETVTLSAATTLEILLAGMLPGLGHDAVWNNGPAAINGARLVVQLGFVPSIGARFTILRNATGTFHDLPEGATILSGGYGFRITYAGGDGDDVELIYDDAPIVTGLGPLTIDEDAGDVAIPFAVSDDTVPASDVQLSAVSMNQSLLADADVSITGVGSNRTLLIRTRPDAHGTAEIRLTASDGLSSRTVSFILTVNPVNDAPTISPIAPQSVPENMPLEPVAFTVDDVDNDVASLTVTATSSNPEVPDASLVLGGSGATRTIAVEPVIGVRGPTTITLTVSDGQATNSTTFVLTLTERTYYLAEGATGAFFDTDILLANPNDTAAPIIITFLKDDGTTIVQNRTLSPTSRATIRVDEIANLENATFSTIVTSTNALPIVVERTMRWDATGYGAHTEKATAGVALEWTFAEGAEGGFFSTYLLLGNPHATENTAHVRYLREGELAIVREHTLAPNSRTTIRTALEPELRDRSFGAIVTFAQPGVAERAMYFGDDPVWRGGHAAAGATAPYPTSWFFAEGATGDYFTTFLLLANPLSQPADVTLTYLPDTGVPVARTYTIQPEQRRTINIALEDPSLAHAAVATRVESTQPIVAERAQYWGQPAWIDAHVSTGVTAAAPRWGLAEGRVGGADEAQTYVLLANPGTDPAEVTITFLRENGTTLVKSFTVPPTSRFNVAIVPGAGSMAPEVINEAFGARIESTLPIVVERSLYANVQGVTWAAGTNATATRLP